MRKEARKRVEMTWTQVFEWLLLFGVLMFWGVSIVRVHLYPDPRTLQQLVGQYRRQEHTAMDRGTIYDKHGDPLALSVPTYSVFLDPGVEGWDQSKVKFLIPLIGKKLVSEFSKPLTKRFYWVERYLSQEEAQKIVNAGGKGFYIKEERKRTYPKEGILSHVLGFCDQDGWGLAGIELKWNSALYIPERVKTRYRGANTVPVSDEKNNGQAECGLHLTIDSTIQYAAERFLGPTVEQNHAKWGVVVCLESKTGAVAAMASWPAFNPNNRKTFSNPKALSNNAINRVYEPGSTFKPIITGIAMDRGLLHQNDAFRCPARLRIADGVMSDSHPRDHGIMTITQILEQSSNVGMAQVGLRFNPYDAYQDLKFWGIGRKTGVQLNGEESGLLLSPERWYGVIPANIAIGQGIGVTPLQLVVAFNAIVDGGILFRPYIVERVVDGNGQEVFHSSPEPVAQVLSANTARWLRGVLRSVIINGTGKPANSPLVKIAGKTGTAQIAEHGKYVGGKYNGSMIGFWPYDDPEYTMLVLMGEVTGERYYGAQVAGPLFRNIIEEVERLRGASSHHS